MKTRRNFLSKGVRAAGAVTVGTLTMGGDARAQAKTWKRTTNDSLIRIGALTSGHHHHLFSIWGPMINPVPQNNTVLPRMTTTFRRTPVWRNIRPECSRISCEISRQESEVRSQKV